VTDPRLRVWLLVCVCTLALVVESLPALGALAVLPAVALLLHPQVGGWRLRILGLYALFAWSTAFSQALFYAEFPRTPLLRLGPVVFWREGALYGLAQSLRFMATLSAGVLLAVSTPVDRLTAGLVALRVPYGLVLMATAAVRFVPVVGREWLSIRAARARRGRPAWRRPPWALLRLELSLLLPLVARSLRRARALAESLETRGFDPLGGVTGPPLRATAAELVVGGATGLLTGGAIAARGLFWAYAAELWYHPGLRPLYAFVRGWL